MSQPSPDAAGPAPEITGPTFICRGCGKLVPTVAHSCPHCLRWRGDIRLLKGLWLGCFVLFLAVVGLLVWGVLARRWGTSGRLFDPEILWQSADFLPLAIALGVGVFGGALLEVITGLKIRASWRRAKEVCSIRRRCEWCGADVLATAAVCPQCRRTRRDVRDAHIAAYALLATALVIGLGGFLLGYATEVWHAVPEPETVADQIREAVGTAEKRFDFKTFVASPSGVLLIGFTLLLGLIGGVLDLVADARMYRWRR